MQTDKCSFVFRA